MNTGRLVFTQVTDMLDPAQLARCVSRYPMPRSSRTFSARDQFLSMAFAHLTFRESLRDIEFCLRGSRHLFAMGIRGTVARSNLAYANEHRDWRVYRDLAQVLIRKARRLYARQSHGLDIDEMVYALDSTTIDVSMGRFPSNQVRHQAAHLGGPSDQARAFFFTRAKSNLRFYVSRSNPIDPSSGLRCDQLIGLSTAKSKALYPEKLRRIRYIDPETCKSSTFLTDHLEMPAMTIAAFYKSRWQI